MLRLNILGSPNLSDEELGKVHWCTLLRLAKDSNPLRDVGLRTCRTPNSE